MYLSKVLITGSACRNPYEIHRVLWKLFPEHADASRDFLFRVERAGQQQAEVLMQSLQQPIELCNESRILACRDYLPILREGQRLRFLLVANPVKTISDEDGRQNAKGDVKKCRIPLIKDEERRAWFERKIAAAASVDTLLIDKQLPLCFRKNKDRNVGKIQPIMYQGTLHIQNVEALMNLIRCGIGPAKAFGCGLLSLARA
ncbi:MAG TPA: type I-E CRISPR-associated protein Cas6/Cse3/CasE [Proteobacteria bacterium]|nr:type I-E CRISPR-associated protein Cas6/Cse3/CasE [Pseudomonadota bacterium]